MAFNHNPLPYAGRLMEVERATVDVTAQGTLYITNDNQRGI